MGISNMKRGARRRSARQRAAPVRAPARTSVSAAVLLALYGMPHLAVSQQQTAAPQPPSSGSAELGEITVTATRREVALEAVPYSLSVVSGEDLARNGVTDIASLANEVPGLAYYD